MTTLSESAPTTTTWTAICTLAELIPGLPTAALIGDHQVAVIRLRSGSVHAIENWDPIGRAMVLARGIVGDVQGEPMLASPLYKQRFSLITGQCLDDQNVRIPVYPVRVINGMVHVSH